MKAKQFHVLIRVVHFRLIQFKIFNVIVKVYIALTELNLIRLKNVIEHFNFR